MYIEKLSDEDIIRFISSILKKMNEDNRITYSNIVRGSNYNFTEVYIDFYVGGNSYNCKTSHWRVSLTDWECKIKNLYTLDEMHINKEWAQYICDTLTDSAYCQGWDFSAIEYKKEYNQYWQKIKKDKIAKIEKEYDDKLFK